MLPRLLLILPAALCLGLLGLALAALLAASVAGQDGAWLAHYGRFLSDETYRAYLYRTLRIATYTTVASLIVGYAIAYVMTRVSDRLRKLIVVVLILQFFSVNVTRIYSLILLIGNNGVLNRALLAAGLTDAPVRMLYNELGVTIGLVNAALPFAVFPIASVLARIPPSLREAAQTLGAGRSWIFWRVIFPLSLPGIGASAVLVFLYSFGAFATPLLMGGGYVDLISVFAYEQALNLSNYGFAAAGAIVASLCGFAAAYALNRLFDWRTRNA